MLTYLLIFISKIIENALSTLRLIVVASGKKKIGAILQFCIALVWILVTGVVVTDLNKDILKIFVFAIGSLCGSYFGSLLEEKIAIGDNLIICKTKKNFEIKDNVYFKLSNENYNILFITVPRKKKNHILKLIKEYDSNAQVMIEKINIISDIEDKSTYHVHLP